MFADSSRGRLIFKQESAFNEVPGANPATTRMRIKSESLHHKNATAISDEIRPDRQRSDSILVGYDVDGDITSELSYGNFDWMIEAALCGTWTASAGSVNDGATTSGSPVVTSATAAWTSADLFKPISGTGIPANSYIGVINSSTSIGLSSSPTANTPVNATATGSGVTLTIGSAGVPRASVLNNGLVNRSFLIERGFMDVTKFISFRGCAVNTLALDITSRRIVQLVAGIMGARSYTGSTSIGGSTTPTEPNANSPVTAGRLINLFNSGGPNVELAGISTKEIKLNVNNNLRIRDIATEFESGDFGRGVMDIGVSFNAYFEDVAIYNAFVLNQWFAAQFTMTDPDDNRLSYRFTLPRLKVNDTNATLSGVDGDVMMPISARAFIDASVGYSVHAERGVTVIT